MINSRTEDPAERRKLPGKLKELDRKLQTALPSEIYAGDEIQIMISPENSPHPFNLYFEICKILYPLKFRFGFGMGKIEPPIISKLAQNNGQAFLNARSALDNAGRRKLLFIINSNKIYPDIELNMISEFFTFITAKWKDKHWRRFFLYETSRNIHTVAQTENVSPEAVNKMINNAGIRHIINALDSCKYNNV